MDRKQRESLVNLLDRHAWYVATTNDDFSNDDFEEAKEKFSKAKRQFIECEPEPVNSVIVQLSPNNSKPFL